MCAERIQPPSCSALGARRTGTEEVVRCEAGREAQRGDGTDEVRLETSYKRQWVGKVDVD